MYIIRNCAEITKIKLYFLLKPNPDPLKKNAGLEHWLTDPKQGVCGVIWNKCAGRNKLHTNHLKTPSFKGTVRRKLMWVKSGINR